MLPSSQYQPLAPISTFPQQKMHNHLKTEYQNKLPPVYLPSPCIHINVRNEIFDQMNSKLFETEYQKEVPIPTFLSPCSHPMLSFHTLIPTLQSPCSHPHDIVPSLLSPCSSLNAPIPMHWSPSYQIDILPSQCYCTKALDFHLLFFSEAGKKKSINGELKFKMIGRFR